MIYLVNKPITKTPLQIIRKLQEINPRLQDQKIAYAGRLDPMAHGLLLLLVEPETKNRSRYQNLDKKYRFEVLFGISTDTHDLMGMPSSTKHKRLKTKDLKTDEITKATRFIKKQTTQLYPPYSSKTVNGKELFKYAREDKLDTITIPSKKIEIYDLQMTRYGKLETTDLTKKIDIIKRVKGDFRQEEIIKNWESLLASQSDSTHQLATFEIHCSSGTYVRQIVHEMGKITGVGALAYDIKRTQIGEYKLEEAIKV